MFSSLHRQYISIYIALLTNMVHQNINLEYEILRDNYIKEYGIYKYIYTPEKQLDYSDKNNLNSAYERLRDDARLQNKDYLPYSFRKWDNKLHQQPKYIFANESPIIDNDIKQLHDDNDMGNLKILHAPNIELPYDSRKEKAAIRIQRVWRECISNPSYLICRKRLLDEFNSKISGCNFK